MECTGSSRPRHGQTFVPLAAALRSVALPRWWLPPTAAANH